MDAVNRFCRLATEAESGGNLLDAISYMEQVIEHVPSCGPFWARLGSLQEDLEHYEKAITSFERSIELNGTSAAAHSSLGRCLLEVGNTEAAVAAFRISTELEAAPERFVLFGHALILLDRYAEAQEPLNRALQLDPDDHEVYYLLGEATRRESRPEAIQYYRESVQRNETYQLAWGALGRELVAEEASRAEGITVLRRAVALDPGDEWSHSYLAWAYRQRREVDKADQHYRAAIKSAPDMPKAYLWYAGFLDSQGRGTAHQRGNA